MFSILKFAFTIFVFFLGLTIISILWPQFRSDPRPNLLTKFFELSKKTQLGNNLNNVLGVTNEKNNPVDIKKLSETVVKNAQQNFTDYAQNIVITYAVRQILGLYSKLDLNQQNQLQDIICKQSASSAASIK